MYSNKQNGGVTAFNTTPAADRVHIGFFGVRNAGKSSLINAVTGQDMSVVSEVKGTTTDPVRKAMELLPLGAVVVIDTAGFDDDDAALGLARLAKTREVIEIVDIAVLVTDGSQCAVGTPLNSYETELVRMFTERGVPYIIAFNKADITDNSAANAATAQEVSPADEIYVSAKTGYNITELKNRIAALVEVDDTRLKLIGDLISPKDTVLLITPIDSAAPKGRMILPQQQVIRDVLEAGAVCVTVKETEITDALTALKFPPRIAVTDSQAFARANAEVPANVELTSFSILFARYNGILDAAVAGVSVLGKLRKGDRVLISEGCTHHRQCDDIGTVKLPRFILAHTKFTAGDIDFTFTSGGGFPDSGSLAAGNYALCIHCGGCMLRKKAVLHRMRLCAGAGVPFTNYGIALAYLNGILERSISAL